MLERSAHNSVQWHQKFCDYYGILVSQKPCKKRLFEEKSLISNRKCHGNWRGIPFHEKWWSLFLKPGLYNFFVTCWMVKKPTTSNLFNINFILMWAFLHNWLIEREAQHSQIYSCLNNMRYCPKIVNWMKTHTEKEKKINLGFGLLPSQKHLRQKKCVISDIGKKV